LSVAAERDRSGNLSVANAHHAVIAPVAHVDAQPFILGHREQALADGQRRRHCEVIRRQVLPPALK
jgi:hypothetical protein